MKPKVNCQVTGFGADDKNPDVPDGMGDSEPMGPVNMEVLDMGQEDKWT
jgi:hypothetical protein